MTRRSTPSQGKIIHKLAAARSARTSFQRTTAPIDATPLFLVLLSAVYRWTGDPAPARLNASIARSSGSFATATATATASSSTSGTDTGSPTRAGRTRATGIVQRRAAAQAPIALVEVQGYLYDASAGSRCSRARRRDAAHAGGATGGARSARVQRRSGSRAGASTPSRSTANKRPSTRALEHGPPLWSGIVDAGARRRSPTTSCREELLSGWGIRTLASDDAAYNPLSYHNGTVWPHDTALAAGLARYGCRRGAADRPVAVSRRRRFDWSLPEVFAGYARDETPFPIAYPTAARPQAWAAGTPILLVRVLLGIEPDRERQRLVSTVTDELPSWLDGLRIEGVRAYRSHVDGCSRARSVTIAEGV